MIQGRLARLTLLTLVVFASARPAFAQDEAHTPNKIPESPAANSSDSDDFPRYVEEDVQPKTYTSTEVHRICQPLEGRLISYYGEIYRIQRCVRRPVLNNKTVYQLMKKGESIKDVDGEVIAALAEGEPMDRAMSDKTARSCRELEGKYVTFSNVDIYVIQGCKKRQFPDWETYIKHRERHDDKKGQILSLSWVEFSGLSEGEAIASVLDAEFAKLLSGSAGVDVIPVDEACEGVNGKMASYYSHLYKIERCRKREVTAPDMYFKRRGAQKHVVKELTSSQWLSLPDGAPIENEREQPQSRATTRSN